MNSVGTISSIATYMMWLNPLNLRFHNFTQGLHFTFIVAVTGEQDGRLDTGPGPRGRPVRIKRE